MVENDMRDLSSRVKKTALAGLAATALIGGAVAVSTSPAEAGASTGTWRYGTPYRGYGYRPYYGYRRGYGGGGVAAGVATGLAVGALAASTPYYGYPAYGYAAPVYGGDCYWVRRRVVDDWGQVFIRRVQVCD
jgi:hypothetical protein